MWRMIAAMRDAPLLKTGSPGPAVSGALRPARLRGRGGARRAGGLAALILSILLVTLEPYQAVFQAPAGSGNLVNQLGYAGLAVVALLVHLSVTPRAVAAKLLRPAWMAMALVLVLSSTQSIWRTPRSAPWSFRSPPC